MLEVCSVSHCSVGRLRSAERGDSGASGRRHTIASSYARHCVLYLSVQRHYPCMFCRGFPRVIQRTVPTEYRCLPSHRSGMYKRYRRHALHSPHCSPDASDAMHQRKQADQENRMHTVEEEAKGRYAHLAPCTCGPSVAAHTC